MVMIRMMRSRKFISSLLKDERKRAQFNYRSFSTSNNKQYFNISKPRLTKTTTLTSTSVSTLGSQMHNQATKDSDVESSTTSRLSSSLPSSSLLSFVSIFSPRRPLLVFYLLLSVSIGCGLVYSLSDWLKKRQVELNLSTSTSSPPSWSQISSISSDYYNRLLQLRYCLVNYFPLSVAESILPHHDLTSALRPLTKYQIEQLEKITSISTSIDPLINLSIILQSIYRLIDNNSDHLIPIINEHTSYLLIQLTLISLHSLIPVTIRTQAVSILNCFVTSPQSISILFSHSPIDLILELSSYKQISQEFFNQYQNHLDIEEKKQIDEIITNTKPLLLSSSLPSTSSININMMNSRAGLDRFIPTTLAAQKKLEEIIAAEKQYDDDNDNVNIDNYATHRIRKTIAEKSDYDNSPSLLFPTDSDTVLISAPIPAPIPAPTPAPLVSFSSLSSCSNEIDILISNLRSLPSLDRYLHIYLESEDKSVEKNVATEARVPSLHPSIAKEDIQVLNSDYKNIKHHHSNKDLTSSAASPTQMFSDLLSRYTNYKSKEDSNDLISTSNSSSSFASRSIKRQEFEYELDDYMFHTIRLLASLTDQFDVSMWMLKNNLFQSLHHLINKRKKIEIRTQIQIARLMANCMSHRYDKRPFPKPDTPSNHNDNYTFNKNTKSLNLNDDTTVPFELFDLSELISASLNQFFPLFYLLLQWSNYSTASISTLRLLSPPNSKQQFGKTDLNSKTSNDYTNQVNNNNSSNLNENHKMSTIGDFVHATGTVATTTTNFITNGVNVMNSKDTNTKTSTYANDPIPNPTPSALSNILSSQSIRALSNIYNQFEERRKSNILVSIRSFIEEELEESIRSVKDIQNINNINKISDYDTNNRTQTQIHNQSETQNQSPTQSGMSALNSTLPLFPSSTLSFFSLLVERSKLFVSPLYSDEIYLLSPWFKSLIKSNDNSILTIESLQKEDEPIIDLIFVHGLLGNPLRTWRLNDFNASSDKMKINDDLNIKSSNHTVSDILAHDIEEMEYKTLFSRFDKYKLLNQLKELLSRRKLERILEKEEDLIEQYDRVIQSPINSSSSSPSSSSFSSRIESFADDSISSLNDQEIIWPRDWLASDLGYNNIRILSIGFRTSLIARQGDTGTTLESRAKQFLSKLCQAQVGSNHHYSLFITHSMGGLLTKQMIVESSKQTINSPYYLFHLHTLGCIFLSTPHFGAWLSKNTTTHSILTYLFTATSELQELEQNSTSLIQLNHMMKNIVNNNKIDILSIGETESTPLPPSQPNSPISLLLVPSTSANPGYGKFLLINGLNHINVCKPNKKEEELYQTVLNFIKDNYSSMMSKWARETEKNNWRKGFF